MKRKRMSSEELEALVTRAQAAADTSGGWWRPKEGRNVIRILPAVGNMEFFFVEVGRHYLPDGASYVCPMFTQALGDPCPICELTARLNAGSKADKSLASDMWLRKSFLMNVLDRVTEEVYRYSPGVTIFNALASFLADPDYGDFTDPHDGFDVVVNRKGTGIQTEYTTKLRRNESPLANDEDEIEALLDAAVDLSQEADLVSPLSEEELLEALDAVFTGEDEGEEDRPVSRRRRTTRRAKVTPDEDEDDDDDEEEEVVTRARRPVKRRRSG